MTEFNIFVEKIYENFEIDELKVHSDTVKMTEYIFKDKNIIDNSCLKNYKYSVISFDIVLVNNEEIHRINKEYRKKDAPTDVITFAIFADSKEDEKFIFDGEINLGEIIVSLDKIQSQAKENNTAFTDELYYILSHGILHLLGYDHQNETDFNFMVETQNKIKAKVL